MKKNFWLLLGLMVATGVAAQSVTNVPAPVMAPTVSAMPTVSTNAPAKISKKKRAGKRKRFTAVRHVVLDEPAVTLAAGPAEVAADRVNVRGQAGLKGEFVTHLSKGDAVTVLSQVNLDKHQIDEPAQWAKISFPTNAHVWVSSQFIDATNKTVLVKKLNLRAGPGENYSVLGVVERGASLDIVSTKDNWTEIEPPADAYAFVAAMYLKQESSGNLATNLPPSAETEPAPAPAVETPPVAAPPTTPPTAAQIPITDAAPSTPPVAEPAPAAVPTPVPAPAPVVTPPTNAPAVTDTNETATTDTNLAPAGPVSLEGVVRHTRSVIEPTDYEIYDPSSGMTVDYLYSPSTNLDLSVYRGRHVVVTGEESMAERWPNTPVLTIDQIHVVK